MSAGTEQPTDSALPVAADKSPMIESDAAADNHKRS